MSADERDPYASRTGGRAELRERCDPVLHGPARGALSAAQRERFDREGYLFVTALLSDAEVAELRRELGSLRDDERLRGRAERVYEPDSGALRSIFAVHELSAGVGELVRHPRLLSVAREILGGDVYIHQTRVNYKPGFEGREFYWHSDFETWHVEDGMPRMRAISVSINLTDNTPYNGPLMVVPGSHRRYVSCAGVTPEEHYAQSLRKQQYGTPPHDLLARLVDEGGITAPVGAAGCVTFFDSNLMHGSSGNLTPWERNNVFIVYNSVDNALRRPYSGQAPRPDYIASRRFEKLG